MKCPVEIHQFLNTWENALTDKVRSEFAESWVAEDTDKYFGFIPTNAEAIFVGTFPVPENRTSGFFYHSDSNLFWPILENISGKKLILIEDKLRLLTIFKIGITDILYEVKRPDGNCMSRADSKLIVLRYNNLYRLLRKYENIVDIFFTSGGPTTKSLTGNSAGGWFGRHLRTIPSCRLKKSSEKLATKTVNISGINRPINLHYLYTPAPQDKTLGKHLRNQPTAMLTLNDMECLNQLSDLKAKYKAFQWSIYLNKINGLVNERLRLNHTESNLKNVLMEH